MEASVARVVLDSPLPQLDHVFDYAIPAELAPRLIEGMRVRVPLRSTGRLAQGWVVEFADTSVFEGQLAPIHSILTETAVLPHALYDLARAVADRAAGNVSDVLRVAIPPRHVKAERTFLEAPVRPRSALPEPRELSGFPPGTLAERLREGTRSYLAAIPRLLASPQGVVTQWAANLAEIAADVLSRDCSVIIAVPDFRDQFVLERALSYLVPSDRIVSVDARHSGAERFRNHLRILQDDALVIIGNRSAVYAPAARLGAIVMWNDGDQAFSEPLSPGVHARDVALIRARDENVPLVVSSFAPSSDVMRLRELAWMDDVKPVRPVRPRVVLDETTVSGITSAAFAAAREALASGPVLLQVAQPGYSRGAMCAQCRQPARCGSCAGPLAFASPRRAPACRTCGASAVSWTCPHCETRELKPVGAAAGRTAEDLGRAFPGVPVVIADGERPVLEVPERPALVIATRGAEPIAEGGYHAVVLLDAARLLAREGLSVSEDALRTWLGAACLAAPGAPVHIPHFDGPLARALASGNYEDWVRHELAERRELNLPPATRVASVRSRPETLSEVTRELKLGLEPLGVTFLGPLPLDPETNQLVLRFDYGQGEVVARALKALSVRMATRGRKPVPPGARRGKAQVRVRLDDREVYS